MTIAFKIAITILMFFIGYKLGTIMRDYRNNKQVSKFDAFFYLYVLTLLFLINYFCL